MYSISDNVAACNSTAFKITQNVAFHKEIGSNIMSAKNLANELIVGAGLRLGAENRPISLKQICWKILNFPAKFEPNRSLQRTVVY